MSTDKPLRYQEDGNIHLDFHGATNTTIDFIVSRFGVEVLNEIFARVGTDVYADIRAHLMAGNAEELARHWGYFFEREHGDFDIAANDDEIVLTVRHCPAYHHVRKIAPAVSKNFCDQTIRVNDALGAGTPFSISTEITGEGACRQVIRRRA